MSISYKDQLRFESYIDKEQDENGCWSWFGSKKSNGRGQITIKNKCKEIHRVSYELYIGPIPKDLFVCHSCDNPSCCNPEHLWLGTQSQNIKDCFLKGRSKNTFKSGENHPKSKLTEKQVLEIRAKYKKCKSSWDKNCYSLSNLAKEYSVSIRTIQGIISNKRWREIS